MELLAPQSDRRVIPRWRDSRATVASGELDSSGIVSPSEPVSSLDFEHKIAVWKRERTLESAAELVSSALVHGRIDEALDAASAILAVKGEVAPAAQALADILLSRHVGVKTAPPSKDHEPDTRATYARIHDLRLSLIDDPRNATAWVDLSRSYSILGQHRHSAHAMDIALALAPTNRFVLRSASRLLVHLDEPDRAHEVLRRNEQTATDPWLMSAEIAVAAVAEKSPLHLRRARQMLNSASHAPRHLAELASALATVEMSDGSVRRARQLFRQSLIDPTENAVAQAGWASRRIGGIDVAPELMAQAQSFEAQAIAAYEEAEWRRVLNNCGEWLGDEPFSSRPAALGSYVAITAIDDHALGERFAMRGLQANPNDPLLRNNLVVALLNQNRVEDAAAEFARIAAPADNKLLTAVLLATEGLLSFRSGAPAIGRSLYREAIKIAGEASARRAQALAAVHLAREEMFQKSPEAPAALNEALKYCKDLGASEVFEMLRLILTLQSEKDRTSQ